jgi:hypothetical protein
MTGELLGRSPVGMAARFSFGAAAGDTLMVPAPVARLLQESAAQAIRHYGIVGEQ